MNNYQDDVEISTEKAHEAILSSAYRFKYYLINLSSG